MEPQLLPLKRGQHQITLLPRTATDLPFFYFTKRKELLRRPIEFQGADEQGRPMRWAVTPNADPGIGAPAIEAHEVWVRLVMPAISAQRAPDGHIPEIVPLGRLRECLRFTGWTEGGWQARRLLKALRQIGAAWCVADLWMPTSDLDEHGKPRFAHLKGEFSRMAIYAIGSKHLTEEQLRDGKFSFDFDLEDTVYVQLHALELTIQRHQPRRLVDNQYLFSVSPASRRWYELIAPKIYGTIKHNREYCEVRYSWYIRHHHTLKRHHERRRVVEQMRRITEQHLQSRYLLNVEYRAVREPGKELDYLIRYYPGPAAKESIERVRAHMARPRRSTVDIPAYTDQAPVQIEDRYVERPRPHKTAGERSDDPLLAELVRRGVHEEQARKLLAGVAHDQPMMDQLEWADHLIAGAETGEYRNPAGFYIYVIRHNIAVPDDFETSRKRRLREEVRAAQEHRLQERAALPLAWERYKEAEIDRHIEQDPERFQQLVETKKQKFLGANNRNCLFSAATLDQIATGAARAEIARLIAFLTFEAFCEQERQRQKAAASGPPSGGPGQGKGESAEPAFTV